MVLGQAVGGRFEHIMRRSNLKDDQCQDILGIGWWASVPGGPVSSKVPFAHSMLGIPDFGQAVQCQEWRQSKLRLLEALA